MGQILHGSATTTEAVRRAIQHSQESLRSLAKRYGINQKTVAKWKARTSVADRPTGPKEPKSTVLAIEEEAIVVAFRRHTLLPLDDCLYALQATIPHLTRSSLHRCLQRHGISRLPDVDGDKPAKRKFKAYAIGYVHIDIAEVRTAQGKLHLFVAIDRTSKFAFVQLAKAANTATACGFLEALIAAVPYKIHTVLTDNGIQFANLPKNRSGPTARFRGHPFDRSCRKFDIEHRLTKPKHPWTNGQVERMNRTIKEATVKRFPYETHDQLTAHLADFVSAYNFARRLKTLKGLTPYETICNIWTKEPKRFIVDPIHQMPGLNTVVQRAVITIGGQIAGPEDEDDEDLKQPLPDRLVTELTAERTLALRDKLASTPAVAFQAVLHKFCLDVFSRYFSYGTAMEVSVRSASFPVQAQGLKDTPAAKAIDARHKAWEERLPKDKADLWDWLTTLTGDEQATLFAHCASFGVNALYEKGDRYGAGVASHTVEQRIAEADRLAQAVDLDMVQAGWRPTVENYLGRVPKRRILEAVQEGAGERAAQLIDHLKKGDMAKEAERLLADTGWLPEPLRIDTTDDAPVEAAEAKNDSEALPEFLAGDDEETEADAPQVIAAE